MNFYEDSFEELFADELQELKSYNFCVSNSYEGYEDHQMLIEKEEDKEPNYKDEGIANQQPCIQVTNLSLETFLTQDPFYISSQLVLFFTYIFINTLYKHDDYHIQQECQRDNWKHELKRKISLKKDELAKFLNDCS